jgi:CheY-like chemotaxis protein
MTGPKIPILLIAEDDPDDRLLCEEALADTGLSGKPYFVEDGNELIDYLFSRGRYARAGSAPRPDLILMDLKMPRKNGWEAMIEIKSLPELAEVPIVILSTSMTEEERRRARDSGAADYYIKPASYKELVAIMRSVLDRYCGTG